MKRYQLVLKGDTGLIQLDEHPEGNWVHFKDHEAIIQRQASAARSGMDAAKAISSHQLKAAARLNAESSPTALESERQANAKLTQEFSLAEEGLANYAQEALTLHDQIARLQLERAAAIDRLTPLGCENAELRALLIVASEALTAFITTYNGRPSRFAEAERASGEIIMAAADKVDAFLYPELYPPEPQPREHET